MVRSSPKARSGLAALRRVADDLDELEVNGRHVGPSDDVQRAGLGVDDVVYVCIDRALSDRDEGSVTVSLRACCGEAAPWMALTADAVLDVVDRAGCDVVVLDLPVAGASATPAVGQTGCAASTDAADDDEGSPGSPQVVDSQGMRSRRTRWLPNR